MPMTPEEIKAWWDEVERELAKQVLPEMPKYQPPPPIVEKFPTQVVFEKGGDYATPHALSAGLWQALICTIGGLMLAIPTHLAYHFLSSRVRALVRDVEWAGNEMMRYLLSEYSSSVRSSNDKANL